MPTFNLIKLVVTYILYTYKIFSLKILFVRKVLVKTRQKTLLPTRCFGMVANLSYNPKASSSEWDSKIHHLLISNAMNCITADKEQIILVVLTNSLFRIINVNRVLWIFSTMWSYHAWVQAFDQSWWFVWHCDMKHLLLVWKRKHPIIEIQLKVYRPSYDNCPALFYANMSIL